MTTEEPPSRREAYLAEWRVSGGRESGSSALRSYRRRPVLNTRTYTVSWDQCLLRKSNLGLLATWRGYHVEEFGGGVDSPRPAAQMVEGRTA